MIYSIYTHICFGTGLGDHLSVVVQARNMCPETALPRDQGIHYLHGEIQKSSPACSTGDQQMVRQLKCCVVKMLQGLVAKSSESSCRLRTAGIQTSHLFLAVEAQHEICSAAIKGDKETDRLHKA